MSDLTVIRGIIHDHTHGLEHSHIRLVAGRSTLAKRRWRGRADDGREFGFDLDEPLSHGAHFHVEGSRHYILEQAPEEILEVTVKTMEEAARVAWNLGNLHFGVQAIEGAVRVQEDPAVLQYLEREHLPYRRTRVLFLPLSPGAHHSHGHSHE